MARTLHGDHERYEATYFAPFKVGGGKLQGLYRLYREVHRWIDKLYTRETAKSNASWNWLGRERHAWQHVRPELVLVSSPAALPSRFAYLFQGENGLCDSMWVELE
jgi:hypothetical protein